jgi:hypothetical protein
MSRRRVGIVLIAEEIAAIPEFEPVEISAQEFEKIWTDRFPKLRP